MTHESTLPPRSTHQQPERQGPTQGTSPLTASPNTPPSSPAPTAPARTSGLSPAQGATHQGNLLAWARGVLARPWVREILGWFLASRLGFILVTYVGYILILAPKYSTTSLGAQVTAFSWDQWDAMHYLGIAQHGYVAFTDTAFFPLYPLLIHLLAFPFGASGAYWAGLLISNLAFLGALLLFYQLIVPLWGGRVASLAVLYLTVFPTALYTFAPYNESLFLALSLGCFLALQRRRWALAGVIGGLAALSRAAGLLLVIPFAIAWWQTSGRVWWQSRFVRQGAATPRVAASAGEWTRLLTRARVLLPRQSRALADAPQSQAESQNVAPVSPVVLLWALLIPLGLALFAAFCAARFGDPLAFSHAQAAWNRVNEPPWTTFIWQIQGLLSAAPASFYQVHDVLDLAAAIFGVGSLVLAWRRLPIEQTLYLLALLLLVLVVPGGVATHLHDPMTSVSRFALEMFPAFTVLALLTVDRPRWREGILICSTMLLATLSLVFILGRWLV